MLEKDRNDSGLKHKTSLFIYLFALNSYVFIYKAGVAAFNLFTVWAGTVSKQSKIVFYRKLS